MSIVESIKSGIARAIWEGVKHAGTAVAGLLASLALKYFNIPLSDEYQLHIAVAVTGALGTAIKVLKDKYPEKLSWL